MEAMKIGTVSFNTHNKRERYLITIMSHDIKHILKLGEGVNYMREQYPDWSEDDNNKAIDRNIYMLNGKLLACFTLQIINEPITICSLTEIELLFA